MRLTRNKTPDGKCKYAIVRLDKLRKWDTNCPEDPRYRDTPDTRAHAALRTLYELGLLEYGEPGSEEECFVIKLKDHFSMGALEAYFLGVRVEAGNAINYEEQQSLLEYAEDIKALIERARNHPNSKRPD